VFNVGGSPTFNQSITLASGAALVVRNAATFTSVTLPTAGSVYFQRDNASTVGFSLNSNVALSGDLTIQVGGGSSAPTEAVTLAGDFSGGFGLIKDQVGELVISGTNTYAGNTLVNNGTLTLASGGGLTFTIAASGVNNQISGDATPGTVSLDGIFSFDLTSAGTTLGDLWNIVDLANLGTVTFGSNFSVADFTPVGGGLWNRNFGGADYQFSTLSGELSVIPEPRAALLGGLGLLALLRRRRLS
jgi:autotransporter-associated beta strand protein